MSRPNQYYPDGFCGGSELRDDLDLDRMIYPERQKPTAMVPMTAGESYATWQERQGEAEAKQAQADFVRDRSFASSMDNVTGAHPGPPRTVGSTNGKEE